MRVRAAVLEAAGSPFLLSHVEIGEPGAGEVLVRIVAAGVCHTDLGVQAGAIPLPLPGIAGHEGAGVVERVGTGVTSVAPGDKVLMSFTSCGACSACRTGHPAYCSTWLPRNLMGGLRGEDSASVRRGDEPVSGHFFGQSAFAEYAIADERSLIPVGADADLAVLAPLGCGVLTGFGSMWNVLDPGPEDTVAVYGTGAVGLAAVVAASIRRPARLIAIDVVDDRLDLARSLGATHTINPERDEVGPVLAAITEGAGVRSSLDTTGSPRVAASALAAASTAGGTVLVCGAPPPGTEIGVDIQGILPGKILRGVTMGDADARRLVPELVRLHAEGVLPLERFQRRYGIEDVQRAADDMRNGVVVKPVILMQEDAGASR